MNIGLRQMKEEGNFIVLNVKNYDEYT